MAEAEKDQGGQEPDERAEGEGRHQHERINDPLTQSGTDAPKVSWQTTPEQEG